MSKSQTTIQTPRPMAMRATGDCVEIWYAGRWNPDRICLTPKAGEKYVAENCPWHNVKEVPHDD